MLPPPMHRCCHRHHHAATAYPNALLLPLKLCYGQAAASAAKLAAATVLLPLPSLPMRGNRYATTAYKIKKRNTIDYPFFHHDGIGSTQQRLQSHKTMTMEICYLQLPRIALMLRSDKRDVNSSIKPY
jgi:hypothetical protein